MIDSRTREAIDALVNEHWPHGHVVGEIEGQPDWAVVHFNNHRRQRHVAVKIDNFQPVHLRDWLRRHIHEADFEVTK